MTSSHTTTEDAVPELRLSCSFYLAVWAYTCICMCIYYRTSLDEEGREIMLNRLILICKNHPARFWPMLFCRSGQESPGPLLANAFLPIRTRITRPASGQCFSADPDRTRIGSGTFSGTERVLRYTRGRKFL